MKLIFSILFHSIFIKTSSTLVFECEFSPSKNESHCIVQNHKIVIKNRGVEITNVSGIILPPGSKTFQALSFAMTNMINYWPNGLEKFAPDLNYLNAQDLQLLEIKQHDLKVFPKLKRLLIRGNLIEVLEKDLFKFNPEMMIIDFSKNNIKEIDGNIFDHLKSLELLYLLYNPCVNGGKRGKENIKTLIAAVKVSCQKTERNFEAEQIKEGTFWEKWWWMFAGLGLGTIFLLIGTIIKKIHVYMCMHQ